LSRLLVATVALVALTMISADFVRAVGAYERRMPAPRVASGFTIFARAMGIPDYRAGVPVLTYHGVADDRGPYTVSPQHFAQQLAMLRGAGFHSVSLAQVQAVRDGKAAVLPPRPILLTFDDGVGTAWTAADPILARYGFRAAMFVITSRVAHDPASYYLTSGQLRAMRDSGRWEIGSHTHNQHVSTALPGGGSGPALNNRVLLPNGRPESLSHWRTRVGLDLDVSRYRLQRLGVAARGFAYPFSATSQSTNDPRISQELDALVAARFPLAFTNTMDPHAIVAPWTPRGPLPRMRVDAATTAVKLLMRLRIATEDAAAVLSLSST
jgi:peptidoglycan/xylan/chitin deacetylase (PgdA/CDA1 family)